MSYKLFTITRVTLPSLRLLAKSLKAVILNNIRGNSELENEDYNKYIQGKGCFVAEKSSGLIKTSNRHSHSKNGAINL